MSYLSANAGQYLPVTHADQHILASDGPDNYLMNFYITQYSSTYRPPRVRPKSNILGDKSLTTENLLTDKLKANRAKTGFVNNERYYLPYTRSLDEIDNPLLGRLCSNNYETSHKEQFKPYEIPNGTESTPPNVIKQTSGFCERVIHNPNSFVPPIGGKEATSYGSTYVQPARAEPVVLGQVGPKQDSAFISNTEIEPITLTSGEHWNFRSRPIGTSEYKEKYPIYNYPKGDDPLLTVIGTNSKVTSDRVIHNFVLPAGEGPYNGGIFAPDSTEFRQHYLGKQFSPEKMGSLDIGPKESSGPIQNEYGYVQTFDDPRRFITTYQTKHYDMTRKGRDREGYVAGGIQEPSATGYTRNTNLSKPLDNFGDERITHHRLDAYQVRSLRARDQLFDDKTHEHKGRLQKTNDLF